MEYDSFKIPFLENETFANNSGVIFDMDGVIFDSESVWKEGFLLANKKFNVKISEDVRQKCCGKDEQTIRRELKATFPTADIDGYRDFNVAFVENRINASGIPLKSGFKNLIKLLKEKGYKLALATASKMERAQKLFEKQGLDPYEIFDAMVFADDVSEAKPNPQIFLKAAERIKLLPSDCFVLEDSLNGVEAAIVGGFKPIMVVDLIEPTERCEQSCRLIARNLDGLTDFFNKQIGGQILRKIDTLNWKRKTVYENFKSYTNPIFSLSVRLDVTNLYERCKGKNTSFFTDFLFVVLKCFNDVEELKIRIYKGEAVFYDVINPSFIVMADDGAIVTCRTRMNGGYVDFYKAVRGYIKRAKANVDKKESFNVSGYNDCFYISCLPWVDLCSVSNPYNLNDMDTSSIPRITWGKYISENGRMKMMIDVAAHHALIDGEPVCRAFIKIQNALDNIENFLKE